MYVVFKNIFIYILCELSLCDCDNVSVIILIIIRDLLERKIVMPTL